MSKYKLSYRYMDVTEDLNTGLTRLEGGTLLRDFLDLSLSTRPGESFSLEDEATGVAEICIFVDHLGRWRTWLSPEIDEKLGVKT